MLRIVMDSAGDLPVNWLAEYDIQVIPINIHFGEKMYLQGVDLSNADFYRMADESGVYPKTSQPTPQQFVDFYQHIAQPGDQIISVHVTGKLSGTMASAEMAARELQSEFEVYPFDSASGSAAMGYMCRDARVMEQNGADIQAILTRLGEISRSVQVILTLNTMEYARRSGRVKALQAALASLLNVKPVIILREGVLELGDRVRTRNKAVEFIQNLIVQRMGNQLVNVAVVHSEDPTSGQAIYDQIAGMLNCNELILTELSIGIAANLGPGTVGIIAYPAAGGG
jgi:DegV family protein with EDD domain